MFLSPDNATDTLLTEYLQLCKVAGQFVKLHSLNLLINYFIYHFMVTRMSLPDDKRSGLMPGQRRNI